MLTEMERATLNVATTPAKPGDVFTESYILYHYLLSHQGNTAIAATAYTMLERTNLFEFGITQQFMTDGYFTNITDPGNLPSDTNKFIVDAMSIIFYSADQVAYPLLWLLQAKLVIAGRDFTPWMLGVRLPAGCGIHGNDVAAGSHSMNNGFPSAGAMFQLPQPVIIERNVDHFHVEFRWMRPYAGASATAGQAPWTTMDSIVAAAAAPTATAIQVFKFGVELHGVRERRVG